ncbi:CvpA family protein [Rhizobium tubonense]|uniref:Colicin V production protein n=1 Tax=Rhizobium tubonense TaxID=484088 RepID=A0A2W4CWE8_9HYPH|nr:CvpA family protein [Rhizobium tubonense]PZM16987.1 colicin V production protein [Rhizobium tubonense]
MPITIFDGIVIGVVLFSAILAMVRGFSREVLSIVSWGGSAAAAYYLFPLLMPYAKRYTDDERIAIVGSAAVVFLIALIIISFITMKIADFIIDSRIGALDRTLGFLFGAARGVLLLVVAVAFWNWLVDTAHRPDWVNNAKSKPFLDSMVVKLESMLPEQIAQMIHTYVNDKIQTPQKQPTTDENGTANDAAPSDDAPATPAPAPAAPQTNN